MSLLILKMNFYFGEVPYFNGKVSGKIGTKLEKCSILIALMGKIFQFSHL